MSNEKKTVEEGGPHRIILRPWPKIIFLYPTMLAALVVGLWQLVEQPSAGAPAAPPDPAAAPAPAEPGATPAAPGAAEVPTALELGRGNVAAGRIFFVIMAFNLLVIAFEFSRLKSVAILFLSLAILFLLLYLGKMFPVFDVLWDLITRLHISASTSFYLCFGCFLLIVYVGVFISTRWNYWEIRHNEIVNHTGFLGDIRRFPSPNLKMTKEITDVFEFLLLNSGRIILYPASEKEAIVLDNILSVNRAEKAMKALLSSISVEVTDSHEGAAGQDEDVQRPM
jgi:hypothetical protein